MSDFTGAAEEDFVLETLRTLVGGRVWETQVPDDVTLPRDEDADTVMPYIIVRFSEPASSAQGRNIAAGEQGQPQLLSFTASVMGGDADAVKEASRAQRRLLVGAIPSDTATPIRSSGGNSYSNSETGSRPTRFKRVTFYRTIFNH